MRGSEAVRFVLSLRDMRKIQGIHGTVAELASVDKEYELAMSVAAGAKMQAVVVDDENVGAEVLEAVKKADVGRVTVLPLSKMMGGKPRGPAILASQNLVGFAIDLLDFDEKYRNAFWYVLGDTVVARTMDQAKANMGGVRIVTMTGELIEASGAMSGGSTKQFQMKFGAASPGKLEEAAAIDGCSPEGTFFRIIFPLLKPTIVTVTILNGMWIWNDYLLPSILLGQSNPNKTLPVAVQAFVGSFVKSWDMILTAALLAMVPMIVIFLLAQKHIMDGMVQGAIK
jgi:hypothetical protein